MRVPDEAGAGKARVRLKFDLAPKDRVLEMDVAPRDERPTVVPAAK